MEGFLLFFAKYGIVFGPVAGEHNPSAHPCHIPYHPNNRKTKQNLRTMLLGEVKGTQFILQDHARHLCSAALANRKQIVLPRPASFRRIPH